MPKTFSIAANRRHWNSISRFMLQSIRQLHRKTLRTSDGEIGHVKDFYFNDQQWAVRYVIADTGSWLLGRLVLIWLSAVFCG